MLNWIVWNRTTFNIETEDLCLTELFELENELFEIELFFDIETMYLC